MNLVRFDSVGGASGDMVLAALVDAGADLACIETLLRALPIEGFGIEVEQTVDHGIAGTRIRVRVADEHHPHRTLADIGRMLEAATIPAAVRDLSLRVFERLAAAEAAVHGTTADQIHFHEVGAMDSIVDIVGACAALDLLGAEAVAVSPLPVGQGTTTAGHGTLPLPVPAVAELLRGFRILPTDERVELVTPTGAALLTAWALAKPAPAGGACTVRRSGYGVGHRKLAGRANVLRALVCEADLGSRDERPNDDCLVLECNLDDTVPELIGSLTGRLLAAGALDVFTTGVQMKKQRPGTLLTVLAKPEARVALEDLIFAESTTFGIRAYPVSRTVLDRRSESVATPFGAVRVKVGSLRGRDVTWSPEHDDCVTRAAERGVAVRAVHEAAARMCARGVAR